MSFRGAVETDSTHQIKNSRAIVAQAIHARGGALAASAGQSNTSNTPFATHQAALQALAASGVLCAIGRELPSPRLTTARVGVKHLATTSRDNIS